MRARSGQELIQVAMTLPVLVLVLIMGCWVLLWQLSLHSTQFVAQEAARAATAASGQVAGSSAEATFAATQAQQAAQAAIDKSFLHGAAAGSPCSSTPASGQVCFQSATCTIGDTNNPCPDSTNDVHMCIGDAATQQALWVCEWYEHPASGAPASTPYKVYIVVAGWQGAGIPVFNGNLPVTSSDQETVQHCGGCP